MPATMVGVDARPVTSALTHRTALSGRHRRQPHRTRTGIAAGSCRIVLTSSDPSRGIEGDRHVELGASGAGPPRSSRCRSYPGCGRPPSLPDVAWSVVSGVATRAACVLLALLIVS